MWIMNSLNKIGHLPRIENPDHIELYKDGKVSGNLFTGDDGDDAEDDISIYVKLPAALRDTEGGEGGVTEHVEDSSGSVSGKPQVPMVKSGTLTAVEERLEFLKREAEIYGEGFLGTGIIICYMKQLCDLAELRSFYNLYIKDENINKKNSKGLTMINSAVFFNSYPIIDFLLNITDIYINGDDAGDNPLLFSIYMIGTETENFDGIEMVRFLLNKKLNGEYMFDVNIEDSDGHTPLENACCVYKNKDLVTELIKRASDADITNCKMKLMEEVRNITHRRYRPASGEERAKAQRILNKEILKLLKRH